MSIGTAVLIMRSAILQILMMSAPILLVAMLVGLIISIFQATTSIQEQTLTFVPKIVAILGALFIFGPDGFNSIKQFTLKLIQMIPSLAG